MEDLNLVLLKNYVLINKKCIFENKGNCRKTTLHNNFETANTINFVYQKALKKSSLKVLSLAATKLQIELPTLNYKIGAVEFVGKFSDF